MNTIKATAADFCNGSIESDQAEILSAILSDRRNGFDIRTQKSISQLTREAMVAQAETICLEDVENAISCAEFDAYYREMARDLSA